MGQLRTTNKRHKRAVKLAARPAAAAPTIKDADASKAAS